MPTKTTKKSVKKVTKKIVVKQDVCPCGCECGVNCPCHHGGECSCGCGGNSVKYTRVWAAWRAFWRRGFCEWAGTSSRSEYWLSWVGNMIVLTFMGLFCAIVAGAEMALGNQLSVIYAVGSIIVLYLIAMIIPAISMMTRRMHDVGLSAWLWLVYALSTAPAYVEDSWIAGPGIGLIVALLPTQVKDNPYHKNNR